MTREEAIRCLSVHSSTNGSGLCTDGQHFEAKQMAIEALEQTTWIPVSERLPEKNVEVLATTIWDAVTIAEMFSANDWFIHEGTTNADADDIVAWMPLPKAYKAESEE